MTKTATKHIQIVISNNSKPMLTGVCVVCAITQTQFVKRTAIQAVNGGHFVSSLNAPTSNIKLPRTTFSAEMHLPACTFIYWTRH